jgi:iron complex transport system substrate-binding protein
MFRSRRAPRLAVALASATLLLATACGGGASDSDTSDAGAEASTSGESAFPVSVDHKYGSTTRSSPPTCSSTPPDINPRA